MTSMKTTIRPVELAISVVGSFVRGVGAGAVGMFFLAIAMADESTPFSEFLRAFHSHTVVQAVVMIGLVNALWALVTSRPEILVWMFSARPKPKQ